MNKMDNLRAMREARYERAATRATQAGRPKPVAPVAPVVSDEVTPDPVTEPGPGEDLCGHRNMGGRTCTRERGHSAKSHRYA